MKKFLAVLLTVALLLGCTALANPSISDLTETVVSIEPLTELPDGMTIVVREAQPETYDSDNVVKIVEAMANPDAAITPDDIKEDLALEDGVNLADYDFITGFSDVVLVKENGEAAFDLDGAPVSAKVTFAVDALKGVSADDLGSYCFLLINPATGEAKLLNVESDGFDSEKGEVSVVFPFLGTFALLQKVA